VTGVIFLIGIGIGIYFFILPKEKVIIPKVPDVVTTKGPTEIDITLPDGSIVTAFKGEWSSWETPECSASCGPGQQQIQRTCKLLTTYNTEPGAEL